MSEDSGTVMVKVKRGLDVLRSTQSRVALVTRRLKPGLHLKLQAWEDGSVEFRRVALNG